ncbi:MAG TPA: response regulator transcription factor [Candidatus Dormibacteraeota bacterium]|jgi:DNA-binding response OmpR family regulator|nr:response regulator transcription factor [Candidatus Dormibacteraeota bacterium]
MHVLVAEDDAKLLEVLARGLRSAGYTVDVAARGDEALALLLLNSYAAAVVDWRMPVMDGIDVVTAIRSRSMSTPVLMLTARDTPSDRIHGLDAGCDDYMVKPFDFQEMLARLRALMRRPSATLGVRLRAGGLSIDPAERQASVNGTALALTPTEYAIVELLVRRSPAVVSRETIANHAWTDALDPIASNSIDVHVTRLRAKLVGAGLRLEAVRSVGYRLVERES